VRDYEASRASDQHSHERRARQDLNQATPENFVRSVGLRQCAARVPSLRLGHLFRLQNNYETPARAIAILLSTKGTLLQRKGAIQMQFKKRMVMGSALLFVAAAGLYATQALADCWSSWDTTWASQVSCTDTAGTAYSAGTDGPHQVNSYCFNNTCGATQRYHATGIGADSSGTTICQTAATTGTTVSASCTSSAVQHRVHKYFL